MQGLHGVSLQLCPRLPASRLAREVATYPGQRGRYRRLETSRPDQSYALPLDPRPPARPPG